jgi:hypothetical protein
MTKEELDRVLSEHAQWLADPCTGCRADLAYANLSYANLSRVDLSCANLSGADLSRSNLSGANLSRSNLSGAILSGAILSGAILSGADLSRATGLVMLTQTDDGYLVIASKQEDGWRILAGCRDFTIDEAIDHWSSPDYHTPSSGRRVVAAIEWFRKEYGS